MAIFLKAGLALVKKFPIIPFRNQLRQFFKKYIRERMYERRKIIADIDGVKHELDLSTYIGMEAYWGNWEPAVVKIINKCVKPGMTVIDIGSSIGLHAFRMKKLVGPEGRAFAVDQKEFAFKALKKTVRLNNNYPIIVDNLMLSDINEAKEIKLDDYVKLKKISRLDFILIDLDGGEYRVIKGGVETLKRFKPMIMIEMHPSSHLGREATEKLFDLLIFCGYSFKPSFIKEAIAKKTLYIFCK